VLCNTSREMCTEYVIALLGNVMKDQSSMSGNNFFTLGVLCIYGMN
jgi:hypothetical protein